MKKIAVICTLYGYSGGTGRVTAEITERYAAEGNEVHVYCTNYEKDLIDKSKITSITKIKITKIGILQPLHLLIKSSFLINRKEFDFVYSTGDIYYHPDIVTVHTLKKVARKKISTAEKNKLIEKKYGFLKNIARSIYCPLFFEIGELFVYTKDIVFIGVSKGVTEELIENFKRKKTKNIFIIENGVDFEYFKKNLAIRYEVRRKYNIEDKIKVCLFIGSDWSRKRLDTAIEIISKIPNIVLFVAGHDDPEPFKEMTKKLNCSDRIFFVGFVKDIKKYYSASDIYIFTSIYETFGLVALESMAAGIVVISNKLNGVEDYIEDGRNGFICRSGLVSEFVDKIKILLTNPELELSIVDNAIETAKMKSWDQVYKQYKDIFDNFTRE